MTGMRSGSKGLMGIGTLIIFISIIVVAAIAAAVFIGSGASMEQRALAARKGTEQEVSTGVLIVSIIGMDARNDSNIEDIEVMIRLKAGSDPINFNTTVFTVDTQRATQVLTFGGNGSASTNTYNLSYIQRGVSNKFGYLSLGDTAMVNLRLSQPITEHEEVTFQVVPRVGNIKQVMFRTPDVLIKKRTFLYP